MHNKHFFYTVSISCAAFCLAMNQVALPAKAAPPARRRPASSARPAANGTNTTGASNAAIGGYLNRLRGKLLNNWLIPDGKNSVLIVGNVNSDGTLQDIQTSSNPKNVLAETAANESFTKSQPLEGLPSGVTQAKLELNFVSTSDPHGSSSSNVMTKMTPIAPAKETTAPGAASTPPAETK